MFAELEQVTSKVNAQCNEIAAEFKGVEDELQRIGVGVHVRIKLGGVEYGYARRGSTFRVGLYSDGDTFRPIGESSQQEKLIAAPHLDAILQAIVTAASEQLKGLT